MKIKPQIIGLPPYKPGKPMEDVKRELGLETVVKLASNENPFGASPKVAEAIQEALHHTAIYPDGYARTLRDKVAHYVGVAPEELIFGNGSDEVIQILCRAFLNEQTNTVMAEPTFSQYKLNAVIEGAELREVPLKDGVHDLDGMLEVIDENTRIVWVCNPNNPTGTYVSAEAFQSFLAKVPEDVLVVSDEAYVEYVTADDYPDTVPMIRTYKNLVVLRTFSKVFGLAALRIGYGVANQALIEKIEPVRPPFNNSTFSQVAAVAALEDEAFVQSSVEKNNEGMVQLTEWCSRMGLDYFPSQTNFLLIHVNRSSDDVFNAMLKKGYIIRSGRALGYPAWIRITIGSKEQNDGCLAALADVLAEELTTQHLS
ncbi:histidinol-phosphate transaminase [Halalkalibacterium halodurans]|uniref:Histidinol-phosphate aminotransferase n=1 Tax=Halalkalibacterium halodurans TaxID=86665 RepID=A0A0M0KKM3_ALKHA|nr:histidinol-phosphate transaminase [Halalkalibacterium halodurans]MED3646081.1 histidinol-phosphate transaminase [Halalkalibacterium halodurans]TES57744.1 histidinol-phosphate transaminase [Halalkalibacterium halodurans]TPE70587.1 histidinol-phosphate transaminase [Halalkalibacterium halodurans]